MLYCEHYLTQYSIFAVAKKQIISNKDIEDML